MAAVGQSVVTVKGIEAFLDASTIGKSLKPKYFRFSESDYDIDPTIEDIDGWIEKDISLYTVIDNDKVEFVCDVAPDEAAHYTKTAGLYLEDGTLFMIAKPPFPFPPMLRQTFKIQLVYQNSKELIDFSYLPFYESEQSLSILQNSAALGEAQLQLSEDLGMLQMAIADYYQFKGEANARLSDLEKRASKDEERIETLELGLLASNASLGDEILKNARQIGLLQTKIN